MNTTIAKTEVAFSEGILTVRFKDKSFVDVDDLIYLYCHAFSQSNGKPFSILFDSTSDHELSEEAVTYLANNNHIQNIIAIAYISKTIISKIRINLFMLFEKPPVQPKLFSNERDAYQWLLQQKTITV